MQTDLTARPGLSVEAAKRISLGLAGSCPLCSDYI
jgi:hypothetical protein